MMRFVVLGGLVSALAFAGCLEGVPTDEGDGDGDGSPGDGNDDGDGGGDDRSTSYVFAWITGNYTDDSGRVTICGWQDLAEVYEENQSITFYDGAEFEGRDMVGLRGLALLEQFDGSGCGLQVSDVESVWTADDDRMELELLGNVTLGIRINRNDGSLTLYQDETPQENAVQIAPGEKHSGSYGGTTSEGWTFSGNYTLRALGHWPTPGITVSDEGLGGPQPV